MRIPRIVSKVLHIDIVFSLLPRVISWLSLNFKYLGHVLSSNYFHSFTSNDIHFVTQYISYESYGRNREQCH